METREALLSLDPSNDDHWTADGQPRLDVLKELTGDSFLNRATLKEEFRGFSRDNAEAYFEDHSDHSEASNEGRSESTRFGEESTEVQSEDSEVHEEASDEPSELEQLKAQHAESEKRLTAMRAEHNELTKKLDAAIQREEAVNNGRTLAEQIKVFQLTQTKQRAAAFGVDIEE